MTMFLDSALVRICAANGRLVGAGFLVGDGQIVTCTHVVARALGLPDGTLETPSAEVHLDFPFNAPGRILAARVIYWWSEGDVAGLELDGDPPAGAQPVRLVTAKDLWGHAFRALGFPTGYDDGVWASGVLRGRQAAGWVQIEDVKETGYWIQPGFSGTPVWDEQLNGVVGMAVAAERRPEVKAAYIIPTSSLIEAWPQLAQRSLDADGLEYLREQLAMFEAARQGASDPRRFQSRVDELQAAIANWDGRVEKQWQRIADGLEEQRQQMAERSTPYHDERRLRVVGQRPQDVVDYFKNRERELVAIGRLLAEPTTRLVSVIGHGGMGKTALACKVLRDLERHRWPHTSDDIPLDGIVYLSAQTAGISLERLFLGCAKVLGGEREKRLNAIWTNPQIKTGDKVSYLLEALSNGLYVILLDNIEDLLDDRGQLVDENLRLFFEHSLTTSHGARLLVTSRIALAFRREVMRFDRQVKLLEGLPTEDGVALLRELDPNGEYGLRDASEEQLTEAVSLAHGVPRALEVLAGILANDPFASLADVLEEFYEQEDVVQALIEENYRRLDTNARRVIEALAVFRRPVPPLAVDYLLEPFTPGLDVPGIVRHLTRANIVSVDRDAKTVTLHPIDQDYAYSQLPERGTGEPAYTRKALERRAADYYAQIRTPPETWETIDDLEFQLVEFEHRIRAGDYDSACRVLESIDYDYLVRWGHYARLFELRGKLLGQLMDPGLRAANLGSLGRAYRYLGQPEQAVKCHEQAVAVAHEIGDRRNEGVWLGNLGNAYRDLGQVERAIRLYEQALAIAREIGDRRREDLWLGYLGDAYCPLGQFERAAKLYEEALIITREIGDRWEEGACLGDLGITYRALGQVERAIEFYEQALAIAREIGARRHEFFWLKHLGDAYHALGQFKRAIAFYEQALIITREIGHYVGESYQLLELGRAVLAVGELPEARRCCAEALALDVAQTSYQAVLVLGIVLMHQRDPAAGDAFADAATRCRAMLEKTAGLYKARYALAAALVGGAVCYPRWAQEGERAGLLAPALVEYRQALDICSAPGVVRDAFHDLEMIRAAGVNGLEPAFELLKAVQVGGGTSVTSPTPPPALPSKANATLGP